MRVFYVFSLMILFLVISCSEQTDNINPDTILMATEESSVYPQEFLDYKAHAEVWAKNNCGQEEQDAIGDLTISFSTRQDLENFISNLPENFVYQRKKNTNTLIIGIACE